MNSIRAKIYTVFGVCLAIFLALGFASYFLILQLKTASQEYIGAKKEFSAIEEQRKGLLASQSILLGLDQDINEVKSSYLNTEELPGFIETLEKIADSSGVYFSIGYIAAREPKGKNSQLSFSISLAGRSSDILEFVANLENVPFPPYRLVEIRNLNLKRIEESQLQSQTFKNMKIIEGMVDAKMEIRIYTK